MIVCIYLYRNLCILQSFHRGEQNHISNVNTMTEALDIERPDTLNSPKGSTTMASQKEHQQLSCRLNSLNYNHFSDITIIFNVKQPYLFRLTTLS